MNTRHIIGYWLTNFLLLSSCRMSTPIPEIEESLSQAGSNRGELFQVVRHYQEGKDSLKLKAALFLIENMADKCYFTGKAVDEYYVFIDSVYQIRQEEYDIPAIYEEFKKKAIYRKEKPGIQQDVRTLSADYLIENIEDAFAVWGRPWNRHLSFENFCELILPYRVGMEIPETWRALFKERFEPLLQSDTIRTARQACIAINNELIKLPIHIATSSVLPISLRPSTLANIKFGLCGDYANFAVYAMRACGIPVSIETIPHWGRGKGAHIFNTVFDNDKTWHDFSGAEQNPDEHLIRFRHEMPKVYRKTYGKQNSSLAMQCGNEDIPDFFKNPYIQDVTGSYPLIEAKNIHISLPQNTDRKFAYLCVFDRIGWIPVAWGKILKKNLVTFEAIGPNIVYHTALYVDGILQLIGDPFLLDTLGQITTYSPQKEKIDYILERKNPPANHLMYLPPTMLGSKFQGANNPEFRNAVTFHSFMKEPEFKYTTVRSDNHTKVKYVRYIASDKTWGNMAEVEFYSPDSDMPLKGKVISDFKPSIYYPRNEAKMLFDGDPLTFFHTADTLSWGGLELEQPTEISKIRYLIRNDDNGIRRGHEYELFYMSEGDWKSLGKQTATEDDRLLYKNIPKGTLYWLRDYTRGREERIFEIEDNKIIWH